MMAPPVHHCPTLRLVIGDLRPATASGGEQEYIYAATGRATVRVPFA